MCEVKPGGVASGADWSVFNGFHAASFTMGHKRYSPEGRSQLLRRVLGRLAKPAQQRVGVGRYDLNLGKFSDQVDILAGKVHHAVILCAPIAGRDPVWRIP